MTCAGPPNVAGRGVEAAVAGGGRPAPATRLGVGRRPRRRGCLGGLRSPSVCARAPRSAPRYRPIASRALVRSEVGVGEKSRRPKPARPGRSPARPCRRSTRRRARAGSAKTRASRIAYGSSAVTVSPASSCRTNVQRRPRSACRGGRTWHAHRAAYWSLPPTREREDETALAQGGQGLPTCSATSTGFPERQQETGRRRARRPHSGEEGGRAEACSGNRARAWRGDRRRGGSRAPRRGAAAARLDGPTFAPSRTSSTRKRSSQRHADPPQRHASERREG